MGPETLADVKAGDTVTIFGPGLQYETKIVERVTKTLIILPNDQRFVRAAHYASDIGKLRGKRWRSISIEVGHSAAERVKKIDGDHARNVASNEWFRAARLGFSLDGVMDVRAACDKAESVLRELGEWTEPA